MAAYKLLIVSDARKEFESLPHPFRRHMNRRIHFLRDDPRPKESESLGYDRYLLQVYGYDLLYQVDEAEAAVTVVGIMKSV